MDDMFGFETFDLSALRNSPQAEAGRPDLLEGLNDKQIEAVLATEGPVLIIAGAGSGKTRVMTQRIAYLVRNRGVSPWNVLGVTFTNKAANEVKERVARLLGARNRDAYESFMPELENSRSVLPHLGTFHSICVRILRQNSHLLGYENSFVIYDAADQLGMMKVLLKECGIDEKVCNPRAVLSHISSAKNELVSPEQYQQMIHGSYFSQQVAQLYPLYQKRLQQNRAFDFDDLLGKTVELFRQHPNVLEYYQNKFRYILVDEYQDTNRCQYILVNMLAEKHRNLCVVGDSDQSIYSWRGADIRNILDFEKDYPEAKVIKLEQNYRSTGNILEAAHNIIVKNKQRKEKKLWTQQSEGDKITLMAARDEREEGEFIVHHIRERIRGHEHAPYGNFAVLYRTNAQSRVLEEVFLRHGIPYKIVGGVRFYDRKEIKDMLSYLRLILNPHDEVSLMRIINMPPRKIGQTTLEKVQECAGRFGLSFFEALNRCGELDLNEPKKAVLDSFIKLLRDLKKVNYEFPAAGVISQVLQLSGYQDFLKSDKSEEGEQRLENVRELISVASKYDQLEPGLSLATFLEEISLISDIDSYNEREESVTFMTLHSAKGLEFPVVFMCGLEEGIFPHSRSMIEQETLEEERRLMYVGITRAMKKVFLLYAEQRLLYGENRYNAPSQFLQDIPQDLIQRYPEEKHSVSPAQFGTKLLPVEEVGEQISFRDGEKVVHDIFGAGVVVQTTGGIVTVAFKDPAVGVKRLAVNVAPLKKEGRG